MNSRSRHGGDGNTIPHQLTGVCANNEQNCDTHDVQKSELETRETGAI